MSVASTGLSKHEKPAAGTGGTRFLPRDPIAVTIPEAVRLSGLGRSTLYKLAAAKKIKFKKVGTRTLILFASLRALIEADDEADEAA